MEEINSPSETYVINGRRVGAFSKNSVVVESLNFGEPATFFQVAGIGSRSSDLNLSIGYCESRRLHATARSGFHFFTSPILKKPNVAMEDAARADSEGS